MGGGSFKNILDIFLPVGINIILGTNVNPNELYPGTTWEQLEGRMIVASQEGDDKFGTLNFTGGEKEHTLTLDEMPSHNHEWFGANDSATMNNQIGNYPFRIYQDKRYNWDGTGSMIRNRGGSQPHNNLPPYIVKNIWERTA